jgi:hypothetical protein
MPRRKRTPLVPLLLLLSAGCSASDNTGVACTTNIVYGVVVEVRDADTQAGIANIARGSVTDGAYTDSLRANGSTLTLSGAAERTGTYVVDIRATGYQGFNTTGVKVTGGTCHVTPQTVKVSLQKTKS